MPSEVQPGDSRPPAETATPNPRDTVGRGVLLVISGHIIAVLVILLFNHDQLELGLLIAFFFLGLAQIAYVPLMLLACYVNELRQTAKGVWILAGATLLPTCTCFGVLLTEGFNVH